MNNIKIFYIYIYIYITTFIITINLSFYAIVKKEEKFLSLLFFNILIFYFFNIDILYILYVSNINL